MKRERVFLIAFAVLLGFILLREVVVGFLTDWWWFSAVGFETVFTRTLTSRILLFIVFSLFFLIFFFGNLWAAGRRGGRRWMEFYSNLQIPREAVERFRKILIFGVAARTFERIEECGLLGRIRFLGRRRTDGRVAHQRPHLAAGEPCDQSLTTVDPRRVSERRR